MQGKGKEDSQAFPTLNALKLREERAKEEQRARYEARRMQQLKKNKEEKESKHGRPGDGLPGETRRVERRHSERS